MKRLLSILALLLLGSACGMDIEDSTAQRREALAQDLTRDGLYLAGREWTSGMGQAGVGLPQDELDESLYVPLDPLRRYQVEFLDGDTRVHLINRDGGDPLGGERADDELGRLRFELDQGVFAGGRFVLWFDGEDRAAELTIYGSGLPIVASTRGVYLAAE
ncbi:MAG: hypothetical protein ABIJ09_14135 [Pseudomonadota bacterium]